MSGFLGHWTMTTNAKTGTKIWLDGRPMFLVIAGLEDCQISKADPIPNWRKCAEEVVKRMNKEKA